MAPESTKDVTKIKTRNIFLVEGCEGLGAKAAGA
jgi:hypothetical protein